MNLKEFRTLRGQCLLTLVLFSGSLVIAITIASNRWWFEQFLQEKYTATAELSAATKKILERVNRNQLDQATFANLSPRDQIVLYEAWILAGENASHLTPRTLVQMNEKLYLRRAQQTVVSGNLAQRKQALRFLVLCQSPNSREILNRLATWAQKRKRPDWLKMIEDARHELRRTVVRTGIYGTLRV